MGINLDSMIDGLTEVVRAIGRDGKLQEWFWGLGRKSELDRRNAIYAMSARIARLGHAHLATAIKLLAVPQVFEAARNLLKERDYSPC